MGFSAASSRFKGVAARFACSFIYASFGPLVRILSEMFSDYMQVAARMGLAFVFLCIVALLFRRLRRLKQSQVVYALLLGIVSTAIIVFFTIAINEIKIASTIFLLYIASMLTSLFMGTLIFKESLGAQKMAALFLAVVGLSLFMSEHMALGLGVGMVSALLSGVSEGVGNVIRKKLKDADRVTVTLVQFLVITITAFILVGMAGESAIREVSWLPIVALIAFSTLQLALNNLLLFGFQNFDVNIGTVILSLEIFIAAIFGFLIFGETLSTAEIAGGVVIFTASVVSAWEFKKKSG